MEKKCNKEQKSWNSYQYISSTRIWMTCTKIFICKRRGMEYNSSIFFYAHVCVRHVAHIVVTNVIIIKKYNERRENVWCVDIWKRVWIILDYKLRAFNICSSMCVCWMCYMNEKITQSACVYDVWFTMWKINGKNCVMKNSSVCVRIL